MLKNNYIKIAVILGAIVLTIGFTFSSIELKNPVTGNVSTNLLNTENKVESSTDGSQSETAGSEVYFSIFKFISNLSPIKSNN
ncbi:MAG: hypothetical protein K0S32_1863 [Bacteroidetes bacterium]|jgi:hypothetical protein|nr:hypothetical protein [Bacteroidota bacterium]